VTRQPGLDILRVIAVALVMCRHLPGGPRWPFSAEPRALQRGGWIGVDLFFVLSGFLEALPCPSLSEVLAERFTTGC
jgi:peptidoglycan/LPS O-acetylase OafA/YrhL